MLTGLRESLRGDPSGLVRAGWIVAGLSVTSAGYLAGSVVASRERRRPGSLAPVLAAGVLATAAAHPVVGSSEDVS